METFAGRSGFQEKRRRGRRHSKRGSRLPSRSSVEMFARRSSFQEKRRRGRRHSKGGSRLPSRSSVETLAGRNGLEEKRRRGRRHSKGGSRLPSRSSVQMIFEGASINGDATIGEDGHSLDGMLNCDAGKASPDAPPIPAASHSQFPAPNRPSSPISLSPVAVVHVGCPATRHRFLYFPRLLSVSRRLLSVP